MKASPARIITRARALRRDETDAEERLWSELRNRRLNGYRFVRQLPIEPYFADFACRSERLIVELDGSQHEGSRHDERRTRWLNDRGWSVLRFWNSEMFDAREAFLETILAVLDGRLVEACDGAGLMDGLRFRPAPAALRASPSPVHAAVAARPPSPASGRGAPLYSDAAADAPPSPVPGEGPGRGMRAARSAVRRDGGGQTS